MKKMILDIGCGNNPKGAVNCDLYISETPHLMNENYIDPRKISNFVRCDAMHLPFKDNVFEIVNASEVLEHVINPFLLLSEMKRASKKIVTVDVPNLRRLAPEENPNHIYTWSSKSLNNFLKLFFKDVVIVGSEYGGYLPKYFLKRKYIGFLLRFLEHFMEKLLGSPFLKAICIVDKTVVRN